jgi:FixJ family two-component response regulator
MTARRYLYIIDDEPVVRASIVSLVQARGPLECREYADGEHFLAALDALEPGCVVLDLQLDGLSGREVMRRLSGAAASFPMIVVTGFSDLATAVDAFRAGAIDFLQKPYEMRPLLDAIDRGFHWLEQGGEPPALLAEARRRVAALGPDETDILARLTRGENNQDIARALGLDERRVQLQRARLLNALGAPSILAAIRTVAIADQF